MDFVLSKPSRRLIAWGILAGLSLWWASYATAGSPAEDIWFLPVDKDPWPVDSEIRFEPIATNHSVFALPPRRRTVNSSGIIPLYFGRDSHESQPVKSLDQIWSDPLRDDVWRTGTGRFSAPVGNPASITFASNECQPANSLDRIPLDPVPGDNLHCGTRRFLTLVGRDYHNYYQWSTAWKLSLAVGIAAPIANSSADQSIHDWYQNRVRGAVTDRVSAWGEVAGEWQYLVPGFVALSFADRILPDLNGLPVLGGRYGRNVTRAYLVGTLPVGLMQYTLGGSRPDERDRGSEWSPFCDQNSVSGHAYVGSVPFIMAAKMSSNRLEKVTFYLLSTVSALSRINKEDHYPSQAVLGWYMGYLACDAVMKTNRGSAFEVVPFASDRTQGAYFVWHY